MTIYATGIPRGAPESASAARAAIAAGLPWLSSSCPACGQFGSVDLRTLDRHPSAAISSLSHQFPAAGAHPTPVREARNADGRAAVNAGKEKTAEAAVFPSSDMVGRLGERHLAS